MEKYFLDTYALLEILENNKSYEKFKKTNNYTNLLNLLELHYIILRNFNEERADKIMEKLKSIVISSKIKDIKLASRIKFKYKSRKLSYADSLGYAISLNRKIKFLTGDKEFKDLKNVEFIK